MKPNNERGKDVKISVLDYVNQRNQQLPMEEIKVPVKQLIVTPTPIREDEKILLQAQEIIRKSQEECLELRNKLIVSEEEII